MFDLLSTFGSVSSIIKLSRPANQTHLCVHTTSLNQTQNHSEGSSLTSNVLSETISAALFPCLTQP